MAHVGFAVGGLGGWGMEMHQGGDQSSVPLMFSHDRAKRYLIKAELAVTISASQRRIN